MSHTPGTWQSIITPHLCAQAHRKVGNVRVDGTAVYWTELTPDTGNTNIVRWRNGKRFTVTRNSDNAQGRVHSYGGAPFGVRDGHIVFVTQQGKKQSVVYIDPEGRRNTLVTSQQIVFGDPVIDLARQCVYAVCQDNETGMNTLARIPFKGDSTIIVSGADFYSDPKLSPDGTTLCWIEWNHPNMPWDGTELLIAPVDNLSQKTKIAGGEAESITQPKWGPDGRLYFMSDQTGYWNLCVHNGGTHSVFDIDHDCATPAWQLGGSHYCVTEDDVTVASHSVEGWDLTTISLKDGSRCARTVPKFAYISNVHAHPGGPVLILGGPVRSPQVCLMGASPWDEITALSAESTINTAWTSQPQAIVYEPQGRLIYGYYYPPMNPKHQLQDGQRPPLIVRTHGGPTSAASTAYNSGVQFWTSRGFAVLDIDYGGSSGYGRGFRERLRGQWGVVDVEDCITLVKYVISQRLADPLDIVMTGQSSSGFTTLRVLQTSNLFAAGISCFGISNLETLSGDTHKFESCYLDGLVPPDKRAERSPIHHVDALTCPIIFFQGAEDTAVPPVQTKPFVDSLVARHIDARYVEYASEGHGFRKATTIVNMYKQQLAFVQHVLSLS